MRPDDRRTDSRTDNSPGADIAHGAHQAHVDAGYHGFLEPDPSLRTVDELHEELGVTIFSGNHADVSWFTGHSPTFDTIVEAIESSTVTHEDQCSAKHYFDLFQCVERLRGGAGEIRAPSVADGPAASTAEAQRLRIVDVGVYMGGSSAIFAGCVDPLDVDLDLVDTNPAFLQFTYERMRRIFPEAAKRIRLFHGDFPSYVRTVLLAGDAVPSFVHHDGAHDFHQVMKDLACLYYVRDTVLAVAVQDTHLRSADPNFSTFVDAAVYAVFGRDLDCEPIGAKYRAGTPVVNPNEYQGNYFLPDTPEGMFIPLPQNEFKYPHPTVAIEAFTGSVDGA